MRAYFFGNMYLSSIQQGIQAGHVIGEMSFKYYCSMDGGDEAGEPFYEWAANHKTMILLNGGYGENLLDLISFFDKKANPYPSAFFKESKAALCGAVTSVGIILPFKIYEGCNAMRQAKRDKRSDEYQLFTRRRILVLDDGDLGPEEIEYSKWEVELMERLGKFRLAQ